MLGSPLAFSLLFIALMLNIIAVVIIIRGKRHGYAGLLYCIYNIIFFIAPSLVHVYRNVFPFYEMPYPVDLQDTAAFMVLCFTMFFYLGFFFSKAKPILNFGKRELSKQKFNVFFCSSACLLLIVIAYLGVGNFIIKRSEFDMDYIGQGPFANAALTLYRALSFYLLLFVIAAGKKAIGIKYYFYLAITITIFLIINFPLALPRYMLFAYILALMFFCYPPHRKYKFLLFSGFFVGVVTLFPFINYVTRGGSAGVSLLDYYGKSGDFDGFQSVMNIIAFVEAKGLSFGYQILGAVLTFIPRELWPSKPFATGQSAAEFMGYPFTNISAPFVSELYVDFGWLGVTAGAFIFGVFLRKIDAGTISYRHREDIVSRVVVAIICSFAIIFLRGSIIAVIANISLFILSALAIGILVTRKSDKIQAGKTHKIMSHQIYDKQCSQKKPQ